MKSRVFLMTSGSFRADSALRTTSGRVLGLGLLACIVAALGCYSFSGGGGFPAEIRTIHIQPFENTTPQFDLEQQLFRQLNDELPRALGLRIAGERTADALVRGRIVSYSDAAENYRAGDGQTQQQVQHKVQITIAIEIIDVAGNTILWDAQSLSGSGLYQPDIQDDIRARQQALANIVQQIVDGAQSQW